MEIRDSGLNVTLDDAFAEMNRARQMILGEFALLPNVDQQEFLTAINLLLHLFDIGFANTRFGVIHNLQKPRRMLLGHGALLLMQLCCPHIVSSRGRPCRSKASSGANSRLA